MNDKCKKLRSVVTVDLALCCSQFTDHLTISACQMNQCLPLLVSSIIKFTPQCNNKF